MKDFWQGERVRLRGVEPSDAEFFIRWNLDSELGRALDFLWPPVSHAQVRREVEELSHKKLDDGTFFWMIEDAASGETVGAIKTHTCNARTGTFSYAVHVGQEQRGRGFAGEAVLLVVKYYFEELRYQKVTASVYSFNAASIALHEKLGFLLEGTIRRMVYTRGEYFDLLWYGMTREEWERSPLRF